MELIREPTAFTSEDPKELYNNIFIFIVAEDPKRNYQNPTEMHIFQVWESILRTSSVNDKLLSQLMGMKRNFQGLIEEFSIRI